MSIVDVLQGITKPRRHRFLLLLSRLIQKTLRELIALALMFFALRKKRDTLQVAPCNRKLKRRPEVAAARPRLLPKNSRALKSKFGYVMEQPIVHESG